MAAAAEGSGEELGPQRGRRGGCGEEQRVGVQEQTKLPTPLPHGGLVETGSHSEHATPLL